MSQTVKEEVINKSEFQQWQQKIAHARCRDQFKLTKMLKRLSTVTTDKSSVVERQEQFLEQLQKSLNSVEQRASNTPEVTFPEMLPISERYDEIADLIQNNQVSIIAGETGSGKTTQIPKICLSLGLGNKGLIGHTQPRRIAARTVANRIAEELKSPLGETVGYQVRFTDLASEKTQIKLMTDGVLLAEMQRDRYLSRYEVIIIDEAHERSLNIDFILGLLKRLCKKRPDLKVIITSATIDLEKFSKHFNDAPVLEVSGRTYPVEVVYQTSDNQDLSLSICRAVESIMHAEATGHYSANGDILVFCSGEREIREAANELRRTQLPLEILPLYARLNLSEQNKVFKPAQRRKVVLATNVAETSITVPGIGYVIDPGVARISRYSFRSKVQRLPVERISQASANQRKGRCGRVANGVCIRLYSQEDFEQRPEFTEAEILRSNLAAVILQMLQLNIHDIGAFEFIDRPDNRLLNDGFKLLQELNAVNSQKKLTKIGRQLCQLPVDPKYARILLEANKLNCLRETLIIVSALSIQDPRERPSDKQQAATEKHRLLEHKRSDFLSFVNLWQEVEIQRQALSNSKFKQHCLSHYWSIARIFEWRDIFRQLSQAVKTLDWQLKPAQAIKVNRIHGKHKKIPNKQGGLKESTEFDGIYEAIHRALLSGLLGNVANNDVEGNYVAARNRLVTIFPGSAQAKVKRKPKWIVSNGLLETSKLFAHTVAEIKPEWVLDAAQHLVNYSYTAPHYHARSGAVKAQRRTTLYGLTLQEKKSVVYSNINPIESRQLFIQQALVEGLYSLDTHKGNRRDSKDGSFFRHNQQLVQDIEKLETKTRKRNLLVSEQTIVDFYAERIPADIVNRAGFEHWRRQVEKKEPRVLFLSQEQLLINDIHDDDVAQFPDQLLIQDLQLDLHYHFDPGKAQDGVTLIMPVSVLELFPLYLGDWLVPGLLREKCVALIKVLPKNIRRHFAPAANSVDRVIGKLERSNRALHLALAEQLYRTTGVQIPEDVWQLDKLDNYYRLNYRVMDVDGSLIDQSRDLQQLKRDYAHCVEDSVRSENAPDRQAFERTDITEWDFGELAQVIDYQHQGMTVRAYPMLQLTAEGTISLSVHDKQVYANYYTHQAIVVLAKQYQTQNYQYLQKEILKTKKHNDNLGLLLMSIAPDSQAQKQLAEQVIAAALQQCCFANVEQLPRTKEQFVDAIKQGSKHWISTAIEIETALLFAVKKLNEINRKIREFKQITLQVDMVIEDVKSQLYELFQDGFLSYTTAFQLKQYPRYLKAIETRLDKAMNADIPLLEHVAAKQAILDRLISEQLKGAQAKDSSLAVDYVFHQNPALLHYKIMLDEWRVSLFAQHLKTQFSISEKRLDAYWDKHLK